MNGLARKTLFPAALGSLLALGAAAHAGQKSEAPVIVGSSSAQGALGSARNSTDTRQWIGCNLASWGGGAPEGVCYAENSAGTFLTCYTVKESHLKLIAAAGPDSHILFNVDSNGFCSNLEVKTSSIYPTKKP